MIESPTSDEGFSDISHKLASLENLSESDRAELAYHLLTSLPSPTRTAVLERLGLLRCRDFITNLPLELSIYILSLTDVKTVCTAANVSKVWQRVSNDPILWKFYFNSRGWTLNYGALDKLHADGSLNKYSSFVQKNLFRRASGVGDDGNDDASVILKSLGASSKSLSIDSIRSHEDQINWKFIYKCKVTLEKNWKNANFTRKEINGHSDGVYTLQYDSEKIISGSRDTTIKVWDIDTLKCLHEMKGHSMSVLCLQFDSKYLISGSSDHTIVIWNAQTFEKLREIKGHSDSVLSVSFVGEVLVSGSKDRTVKVWNISTGECVKTLYGHHAAVNSVILSGKMIITASGDRSIKIWDLETGECLKTFTGHVRGIACLAFDGQMIVSGASDNKIRCWDIETGVCKRTLTYHNDLIRTLYCDGQRIFSGSYDMAIRVIDKYTGRLICDLPEVHSQRIYKVQADCAKILSCAHDGKIVILDFTENVLYPELFQ